MFMKNLNKTLLFAFIALFTISSFTQCKEEERKDEGGNGGISITTKDSLRIAYIDIEKISSEYQLAKDLLQETLNLDADIKNRIEAEQKKLEELGIEYQKKAETNGFLTPDRQQQEYQRLVNEEAKLQEYAQKLLLEGRQKGEQMEVRYQDSIQNYVKNVLSPAYDIVLTNGGCLHITPEMDITDKVINDLNARYQK